MKKLAAMLMALMMLLTMAACGQQAPEQTGGTVEPGAQSDDAVTGQVDTPAPDEDTPEMGSVSGGTYTNRFAGISCTLDDSWYFYTDEQIDELNGFVRESTSDEELKAFLDCKAANHPDVSYIMEEFVHAEVNSYDAIIDASGNPIFEAGNVSPVSIMDIVNDNDNSIYYIIKDLPEDTRAAGRAVVKSFGVKSRFVHFEFFRMTEDQASMGEKGRIVALEVNMRPCGGFTPDMINFARSTNVYKIWADMIAFGGTDMPVGEHYYCPFVGRRDGKNFVYSHEQIMQKYQKNIKMVDRIPDALSGAMGNQMYVATFSTREEMEQFYSDVLAVTDGDAAAAQAALSQVLALGEPTKALTPKPNLSPAVKPTTAVTKTPTRAVTKTSRKGRK